MTQVRGGDQYDRLERKCLMYITLNEQQNMLSYIANCAQNEPFEFDVSKTIEVVYVTYVYQQRHLLEAVGVRLD